MADKETKAPEVAAKAATGVWAMLVYGENYTTKRHKFKANVWTKLDPELDADFIERIKEEDIGVSRAVSGGRGKRIFINRFELHEGDPPEDEQDEATDRRRSTQKTEGITPKVPPPSRTRRRRS